MYNSENFQVMEQLVEDENAENLQPSYPLKINEYICKKSEFEDPFMAVSEISLIPLINIFATDLLFCLAGLIHWGVSGCVSVVCLRSDGYCMCMLHIYRFNNI
jgi:hypothetical protein